MATTGTGAKIGRGKWTVREFNTTSTATYFPGALVSFNAALGTVSELSGGAPGFLGVALSYSTASLPSPKVLVAIPNGPECTAFVDVPTGMVASRFSIGWAFGLYKVGNSMSYLTTAYTSDASTPLQVVGPCNSTFSTVECAFITKDLLYGSSASQILL